jgi:RNA polymerase sigma-70 factor (ECF subfamily)
MHISVPALKPLTDEELVIESQAGNREAFAELISRHYNTAKKLAVSILRDSQDAEDEVQNAAFKAFEHIGQFQRDAKFGTWLTRIVVNQCLMRLRQCKRARFLYLDEAVPGSEVANLELPDRGDTPDRELARREIQAVLRKEMFRIPPLLRNVFLLRDVEQLPMPDVAARLGISVAAAKSRLLRARLELRSRMEKHCGRMGAATLLAN